MGYPMLNFSIRPDAVMAMVDRVAELDDASDEFIAGVLETESWEEFIARAAAAAFCEAEGLRVEPAGARSDGVEAKRLVGPYRYDVTEES